MNYELTLHAKVALAEREIPVEWMERTLTTPELCLPDPGRRHRRASLLPDTRAWRTGLARGCEYHG